ncbi:MAG: hypothetical protein WCW35_01025 [Bacteroidota bacterium]
MKMFKYYFLFFPLLIRAQNTVHSLDQDLMEEFMNSDSEEQDVQAKGEELDFLLSHPVNISEPHFDELLKIPFVSPLLAESIIRFTDTNSVTKISQLEDVFLMTPVLLAKITPFITVEQREAKKSLWSSMPIKAVSRSRLERRFQGTKGFAEGKYSGDRNGIYQRIRLGNADYELAAVSEKDAGENYANAFVSGYVSIRKLANIEDLVIGNFMIASSQGMVFSRSMKPGKGANAADQAMQKGKKIIPVTSTDEFRFFQGAAARIRYDGISMIGFYSKRTLPASVDPNGSIKSFYTSGLYRTSDEKEKINTVGEVVTGGVLEYSPDGKSTVGMTALNVHYSKSLPPNVLDLHGKSSLSAGSVSWLIPLAGFTSFGEIASNDGKSYSRSIGAAISISKSISAGYHHRSYSGKYRNPFAHPFGELSDISDGEQGNYLGVEFMVEKASISFYADHFTQPARSDGFPAFGKETFIACSLPIGPSLESMIQLRRKSFSSSVEKIQTNYRLTNNIKVFSGLSISHRIEVVTVTSEITQPPEHGTLTFLDASFNDTQNGIRLKSRIVFFDTHSYDSRLYQYESDVAGNYSNPPLYGKGIRWYLVAGYEIIDNFTLSLKYSETKKLHEVVLGSGDDVIRGNLESRIAMQLDFQM